MDAKGSGEEGGERGDRANNVLSRITTASYDAARTGSKPIESFPDFQPLITELKRLSGENGSGKIDGESLKVTSLQAGGALVIKEPFFLEFESLDEFQDVARRHNSVYNSENIRLKDPEPSPRKNDPPETTVLVASSEILTPEKIASLPDPF